MADSKDAPEDRPLDYCSLSSSGLAGRLAWIEAEVAPHSIEIHAEPDGIRWELRDSPELRARLDEWIAMEAECCSGIEFTQSTSPTQGRRELRVRGVDPSQSLLARLGPSANGDTPEPPSSTLGLIRSLGVGALLAYAGCCLLPMFLGALLGSAVAAPFAALDQPWIIALAAIVGGTALHFRKHRRRRSSPTPA